MKIGTVEQMRHLDKRAIQDFRISPELLMENAGEAVRSDHTITLASPSEGIRFTRAFCIAANCM
jgi:NAD(P)H-hydrate repair Nnr-like enzyme with NAD(P)H-hydrate epimerase domain